MATGHEIAMFGLGNFWEPQVVFGAIPGVLQTSVGYAGGSSDQPTFHTVHDHCETLRIEFDPRVVSFEELLEKFWQAHDPTAEVEAQFRSVIFYFDEAQHQQALESREVAQHHFEQPILTEILPATAFYEAEKYHQHFLAKIRGEDVQKL